MDKYKLINRDSEVLHRLVAQEKDPFKRAVLQCYIDKTKQVPQIAKDFRIGPWRIYDWLRIFAASNPEILRSRPDATRPDATAASAAVAKPTLSTIPPAAMEQYKPLENLPDDPEELKKIIEELHYKVHSRDVMIDIAEEMFGIQIKKKLGPKR